MRKILCLHSSADLYGSDRSLLRLIEGIKDIKFIVVLPYDGPLAHRLRRSGAEVLVQPLTVLRRQYFNLYGILHLLLIFLLSIIKLSALIRNERVDLVYSNTIAVVEGGILGFINGTHHIQHVRETIDTPKIVAWFLSFTGLFSSIIICVSNATRRNYIKHCHAVRKKCVVVYNGINVEHFGSDNKCSFRNEVGATDDTILIGIIGRISEGKGIEYFIDCAETLMAKCENKSIRFIIIGDAFRGQEWRVGLLQKRLSKSPFSDNFLYYSYRDDIPQILVGFDILVLPSIWPDSFPTSVLEAMATGLPVVVTKMGGAEEMIKDGETGFLVEAGSIDQMVFALKKLVNAPTLRRTMGEEGKKRCKSLYTTERYIQHMRRIFQKI